MAPQVPPQNIPAPDPAEVARKRAAQEQHEFASKLDALISRMERDDGIFDSWITTLPVTEHRYSEVTMRMKNYLERERQLAGDPRAFAARSQISAVIGQGPPKTEQIHNQVQSAQWNFENNAGPLMQQIVNYQNTCVELRAKISANPNEEAAQTVETKCATLQNVVPPFKARYDTVSQGLARAEATYQRERQVQEQLVNEAYRIQ